jgi:hypothetical protein
MSIEVPEHLRTGPMAEAAKAALEAANSMAAASNSVPRISLAGKQFKLIESGETVAKFAEFLDVVMVGVEPDQGRMIKTFYAKKYDPNSKEPPDCSSDDGIAPAPWVTNKQNPTCSNCPKNQFGSATSPSGKATKACRDSKRVWLKLAEGNIAMGTGGKPYEVPAFSERTLYGMNVTVASLKAFSDHGKMLIGMGQGPAVCVTRLTMADTDYPQLDFKLQAWLGVEDAPLSLELAEKKPWKVQYKNAGLALAGGDGAEIRRNALPTSVATVPDHLKQAASPAPSPIQGDVVDATPAPPPANVSNAAIDDEIGKW